MRIRGAWRATFVEYESVFSGIPRVLRQLIFPVGFYDGSPNVDPDCIVRRFNTFFSGLRDDVNALFTTIGFLKAFLVAFIAALPAETINCGVRFATVGIVSLLLSVVTILWHPWRVSLNNTLSLLSNLCTAALCFANVKPKNVDGAKVSTIVTATVGIGFITSISGLIMKILEFTKWKKEEQRSNFTNELAVPAIDGAMTTKRFRKQNATRDDDQEMEEEAYPMLQIVAPSQQQHRSDNPLLNHNNTLNNTEEEEVEENEDEDEEDFDNDDLVSSSSWDDESEA